MDHCGAHADLEQGANFMIHRATGSLGIGMVVMILVVVAMLSAGQVLFKFAARTLDFARPASFLSLPLLVALVMYGAATCCWLLVLSRMPLSVAFPFYGLVFLLVPLLSWAILKEPLSMFTVVGSMVIAAGVVIVAIGSRA